MPIANRAAVPINGLPTAIACHIATWFWAAEEAQAVGLSAPTNALQILTNIAGMNPVAQQEMGLLQRSGTWGFNITPVAPPPGTVLFWPGGGTHSGVVTPNGQIGGYNQVAQFNNIVGQFAHTICPVGNLQAGQNLCHTIAENTIVQRAGQLGL